MTLTLKAGRYYKRRDGKIRGPAHRRETTGVFVWKVGDQSYRDNGVWCRLDGQPSGYDLISEVPAPRKRRKAKGRREVVRWCYVAMHGSTALVDTFDTRKKAIHARGIDLSYSRPCGPITRIAIPAPKGKK